MIGSKTEGGNMIKFVMVTIVLLASTLLAAPQWVNLDGTRSIGFGPQIEVLESNDQGMKIAFHMSGLYRDVEVIDGVEYDVLRIPNLEANQNVGSPDLQTLGTFVQILSGHIAQIKITNQQSQTFDNFNVIPTKKYPLRNAQNPVPQFVMNERIYNSNNFYPSQVVTTTEPGFLRNKLISSVMVTPLQYNPVTKQLVAYTDLEIEISFKGATPSLNENEVSPLFNDLSKAEILNAREETAVDQTPEVMLVIAADEFLTDTNSLLATYLKKKEMLGIKVVAKKISEVGATNTLIKEFVQNAFNTWPKAPTYLLLVGNEKTVPTFKRSTSSGSAASDYVYSLLKGNDIFPDLFFGRIIANNVADANTILNRIMKYDWEPEVGAAWYKKALGIASNEGSNPSDVDYIKQIKTALTAYTYNYMDEFFQGTGNATKANINKALNEGRTWLTYVGHGSGTSWGSTNGAYSNSSIDELANGFKLPIIVDVACKNAQFDSSYECFGERWVRAGTIDAPKGAVGYWGGTVNVSWHPPAIMARGVAINHFKKPVYSLGGSLIAGQLYLAEQSGTGSDTEDNFEWYVLFGDPSMIIRTDTPKLFGVFIAQNLNVGATSYSGELQDPEYDMSNVNVAMIGDSGLIAKAITDVNGKFQMNFSALENVSKVQITLSKYNFKPLTFDVNLKPIE